jgi:hypothetical protein
MTNIDSTSSPVYIPNLELTLAFSPSLPNHELPNHELCMYM